MEGNLTGIREGIEGDEFGEMETGSVDGRLVSPLLVRVLDDSLLAAQDTPSPAQIEIEMVRRTVAEVARCMDVFQQQRFMTDHECPWGDVGGYREEPGFGAQLVDVDINVQGREYAPPPFGWAGSAMGSVIHNNPSQLYPTTVGGQATPAGFNGDTQQQWLPVRMDASPSSRMMYHVMPMVQTL